MSNRSRRHFLQSISAACVMTGLHQAHILQQQKILAQPTSRKLALIIGINDYPYAPLHGCVNDAILQRQLLIHRFGFNPRDVVMLLNQKATRQGILDAVEEHLIKQAQLGDVVVIHFSGHGSLVDDPDSIYTYPHIGEGLAGTLVPIDADLPTEANKGEVVADIMGHTLFLLMSAIQTENLTVVLDSCHSGASTRDRRVRAREGGKTIAISPQEKAYQERWLGRFDWSREEFVQRYRQGIAKGVVLAATQVDQLAIDEQFNGFVSGAFSYRLMQYLWQQNSTPDRAIAEVQRQIPEDHFQKPKLEVALGSNNGQRPFYFVDNPKATGHALVIDQQGDRAKLLLVGVDPGTVGVGTGFVTGDLRGQVEVVDRKGVVAMAKIKGAVEVGAVLQAK